MNEHWKNWIGWSGVRQQMWDECPRAFYHRYIGRWEKGSKGKKLQKLSNLRTLRGHGSTFVMDVLGTQLHHALLGRGTDMALAREMLDKRFQYLEENPERTVEHANGFPVTEKDIDAERRRARRLLDNFYRRFWPGMSRAVPLEHGRILSYDVDGHRVWLNVDAAFRDGTGVVVTMVSPGGNGVSGGNGGKGDGSGGGGGGVKGRGGAAGNARTDGKLPLDACSRALWAMKVYRIPHDRVKVERIDLERPDLPRVMAPEPHDIKRFKDQVAGMCEAWEKIGSPDDAPAAPEPAKCRACAFATACQEGKAHLGDGS